MERVVNLNSSSALESETQSNNQVKNIITAIKIQGGVMSLQPKGPGGQLRHIAYLS